MKTEIAKHLLAIKAVFLRPNEPFTWASGMKSPIYCDNRLTLSYPEVRDDIASGLAGLIKDKYPEAEIIAGTATAGIPHAALAADRLRLPMCYVRSKPKAHGKGNQIEGAVKKGQKVVVIEDLISTGGSVLEAVSALNDAGCEVLGVAAIFTYGLPKAGIAFDEAGVEYHTLTDYDTLTEAVLAEGYISEADAAKLKEWKADPQSTAWMKI
ncbi:MULTISPECIES: orotate phosphoribosyltransferase [Bacillus]|uniref:Orotate phosphoribosyltransferase n=1 Tax=Bacillus glycinifermentans TaxID=1664069 RepID=A0AAJ4D243_9BACI|nr:MULTISPECIES: orotate phosphoribosyltransferase [Bacillus]KKB73809.1 orotate phosphoribosyltransferase [Bacillus sp. TH008]MDU0071926.1 orotate phosphoribosyltransferase [Bacillus sp. IG6]MED8019621.1 orotate phosphoribosyltransferase [Bacillus glycinifermentans]QAT65055.1 orotate phosphoribosyltransferase [Bacillus glycinifermentans]WKB79026.1 orotate phosphoribosyltransferase [Bacillus glycinifermentans]